MQALESGDKASRVQLLLGLAEGSLLYPSVFFLTLITAGFILYMLNLILMSLLLS